MEFKEFEHIEKLEQPVVITEKVNGTNGQILVFEKEPGVLDAMAGSKTRWVTIEDDNKGFARWVAENREELTKLLGVGLHRGEWYGSGIDHGYGLSEKRFALFNAKRWGTAASLGLLPNQVDVVPNLYEGVYREGIVEEVLAKLKQEGSRIVPGCMRPEGVVAYFTRTGCMLKKVLSPEEAPWDGKPKDSAKQDQLSAAPESVRRYLQPVRLEKLMSRDERYTLGYPTTLPDIVKDYKADLRRETTDIDAESWDRAGKLLFAWVKLQMAERGHK